MKIKMLFRTLGTLLLPLALTSGAPGFGSAPAPLYTGDMEVGADALRDVVDPLFDRDSANAVGDTHALLILHDGRIVAERYGPGFGPQTKQLSWSLAKTVSALLVGIMVSDGRLALDDPVPVAAWRQNGDPRGAITLRQMLNMASGIAHDEDEGPLEKSDALRLLVGDGAGDMARYAEARPLARTPGSTFHYDSATTLILCDMMTRLLTDSDDPRERRDAMMRFLEQRFAQPLRLASLVPEFDPKGTMIGGTMLHMTARDYGRLGEFLRNHGRVDGHQMVSESWVRFMTTPSPENPGYGAHLWLNRPGAEQMLFPGEASAAIFAAIGFRGQYILVAPRQHLTVVRLGVSTDAELPALRAALLRVVERFPAE